jgi:hypothetical protein
MKCGDTSKESVDPGLGTVILLNLLNNATEDVKQSSVKGGEATNCTSVCG